MNNTQQSRSNALSEVFKAMGHPSRLFILESLEKEEHCVCELSEMVGADMSTISRHLSILKNAGLVTDRKEGTTVYYSLACTCLKQMLDGAKNIIQMKMDRQNAVLLK